MKCILCLLVVCVGLGSSETTHEKTSEAVTKAVESVANTADEHVEDREAAAVAKATIEVIKTESGAAGQVPEEVVKIAEDEAKKTFITLDAANVGTKAAADAASQVAIAELDGASPLAVDMEVKKQAEEAAVAAGKAIADHPQSEGAAVGDAIVILTKEEETPGEVDVAKESIMAKAEEAAEQTTTSHVWILLCMPLIFAVIAMRKAKLSPYAKSLRCIRQEFDDCESGGQKEVECAHSYQNM